MPFENSLSEPRQGYVDQAIIAVLLLVLEGALAQQLRVSALQQICTIQSTSQYQKVPDWCRALMG